MKSGGPRLLALAIVALLLSSCALIPGRYSLLVSGQPDRSSPTDLQGKTVHDSVYVFVAPTDGVRQVLFFVDDESASGVPAGVAKSAPFDLAPGASSAGDAPSPYDTQQLPNGRHTVTALVTQSTGGIVKVTAAFNVNNRVDPSRYSIQISKLNDRSFPTHLQGQTVAQNIFPFLAPAVGIKQVAYFVDNQAASGAPAVTATSAPFDLGGGKPSWANPYDTRQLGDGRHSVTALVTHNSGMTFKVNAFFEVNNTTPASSAIYWGVTIPGVPWGMAPLTGLESSVGKNASIVQFWLQWTQQGQLYPFQPTLLQSVRDHGAIPMITWLPARASQGADQPEYRLSAITGGKYDAFLRDWATAAKAWGHPFFLRFAHEMNGFWYPWGESANGNRPGDFAKAWRHVVDVFRQQGATNVTWVWCPNIDWSGSGWPRMQELYPGDNYVDWTCLDGYNWGADQGGWKDFNEVFRWSYEYIRSFAPAKPMMLGEFGSAEKGGSKAAWTADAFGTQLPLNFPSLHGVVWYDVKADQDWRIESSPESLAGFKAAIASPYFRSNTFGNLSTSPIPP